VFTFDLNFKVKLWRFVDFGLKICNSLRVEAIKLILNMQYKRFNNNTVNENQSCYLSLTFISMLNLGQKPKNIA
jgi:hypothetical protein